MQKPELKPTINQTFVLTPAEDDKSGAYDFGKILEQSRRLERQGQIEKACDVRYQAFQRLVELLPEDAEIELDWEDDYTQSALHLINYSSIDHFLVGDYEMCAAMLELMLELDSEDHLEATTRLAYAYIALEEYELYDEIAGDINDRTADKAILTLWCEYRQKGTLNDAQLRNLRTRHSDYSAEFTADSHPADEAFISEIAKEKPSRSALARELWLQTEHLWKQFPEFICALKATKTNRR